MVAFKYAPTISQQATDRFSNASIAIDRNNPSLDTVDDAYSFFSMYSCCELPSATVRPFIFPHLLSFTIVIALRTFLKLSGSMSFLCTGCNASFWSSCKHSYIMASIAASPYFLTPDLTPY